MKCTELLFDCDNTLVLSERLAFQACAEVANEILEKNGVSDRYDGETLLQEFVGQNFRGMMVSLTKKYGFSMDDEELDRYVKREEDQVIATLEREGQPCLGANEALEKIMASKKYGMAVVSSSALRRVQASLKKAGQEVYFPPLHVFSAATSLEKPTSKPDPAIYLHACQVIGKKPEECIAIEDSKSGTLSALNAKIPVIAYVGSYDGEEEQKKTAKMLMDLGAQVVMWHWSEFEDCIEKIEESS
ncbi:MAG: hypothetical protein M1834_002012 [Cirrosporium novae-zelandiae]|nr:MAG: hypothetical protein M1834_002012 [Cirrosporium novae-zelandiae]